eukprot:TRINITY_DN1639_c2_g1_i1.p1 TRINITY_DN1639_c2_g1~~TRINITY_DN1639_c2_g1_i1.p1  ORF type:complete len:281 (+),score=56.84 TRINITY_DN1639_c2_g1_i1:163-1005(+)
MATIADFKDKLSEQTLKDLEELGDAPDCGFCRATMPPTASPDMRKKVDYHVVVCTDQPANRWHAKMGGDTAAEVLSRAVDKSLDAASVKAKVSVIEVVFGSAHAGPGDVIVFRNGKSPQLWKQPAVETTDEIVAAITTSTNQMNPAPSVLMVCAHTQRDRRCGYCGPILTDLASTYLRESNNHIIAKISHVGGHLYAGNVLHYDKQGMDWFGVVTPDNINNVIDKNWGPELFSMWRGRMGYTKLELPQLKAQMGRSRCTPLVMASAATAAVAAAYFVFRK